MATLYKQEGDQVIPVEVPDEEEITQLRAKAEEYEKLKKEQEETGNKDLKELREAFKRVKEQLKSTGKEVDDNGEPIKPAINPEEIEKIVEEKTNKTLVNREVESFLGRYNQEQRDVIKLKLEKLTYNENVTPDNIQSYLSDAAKLVVGEESRIKNAIFNSSGRAPMSELQKKRFYETDEGKEVAKSLGFNLE